MSRIFLVLAINLLLRFTAQPLPSEVGLYRHQITARRGFTNPYRGARPKSFFSFLTMRFFWWMSKWADTPALLVKYPVEPVQRRAIASPQSQFAGHLARDILCF